MGMNDRMCIEPELAELLEEAIDGEKFSSAALGVSLQVLNQGFESLTGEQPDIFDRYVQPVLRKLAIARELRRNRETVMD